MKGKSSYLIRFIMFLVCMSLVLLPIVASAAKSTLRFADFSWDSAQVHNRIAGLSSSMAWATIRNTSPETQSCSIPP